MKRVVLALMAALLTVLAASSCSTDTVRPNRPAKAQTSTTAPTSAKPNSPPPTSSAPVTTVESTPSATTEPEPVRTPPTAGYQCRDGDEDLYPVCAAHKEWVDGQVEFASCQDSGGTWDIRSQQCVYGEQEDVPSPDEVSPSAPDYRDANGETRAEYCARTGQALADCAAG